MSKEIVVFTGKTCSKCPVLKKLLDNNSIEYVEKDVMDNLSLAKDIGVRSLPTVACYEDGELVNVGSVEPSMKTIEEIRSWLYE